jgi:hypothetical protein
MKTFKNYYYFPPNPKARSDLMPLAFMANITHVSPWIKTSFQAANTYHCLNSQHITNLHAGSILQ